MNLIAEIGINHNGSLDNAFSLIDIAKASGFDYVKFQKRTPEICVPKKERDRIKDTPWGQMTYLEYKKKIEFNKSDFIEISQYCEYKEIGFFASVWDIESARFMSEFCDIVKIPSAMITNIGLLESTRELFDTVIMSTGMSTEEEVFNAVLIGNPDVIMHTHSSYPAPMNELRLEYITWLKRKYPHKEIGYSGHEMNLLPTFLAVVIGATWIERHVTLNRNMWGSDQLCSVEPAGMFHLSKGIKDTLSCLGGDEERVLSDSEKYKLKSLRPDLLELK